MMVEFTRRGSGNGDHVAVNADAVAWIEPLNGGGTSIIFSGRDNDLVHVTADYAAVKEALEEAQH